MFNILNIYLDMILTQFSYLKQKYETYNEMEKNIHGYFLYRL